MAGVVKDIRRKMSDLHEAYLAKIFGVVVSRGSGNQWNNPADGRQSVYEDNFALAWDCKSTLAESMSITLEMWEKICDQAGFNTPAIPVRFYRNRRLSEYVDLVVLDLNFVVELINAANGYDYNLTVEGERKPDPEAAGEADG